MTRHTPELQQQFHVSRMHPTDAEAAVMMWAESWRDTYINEAEGVSRAWVEEKIAARTSPEKVSELQKRIEQSDGITTAFYAAKNAEGAVIGIVMPRIEEDGTQRVGSLYVDKHWHGKGVAAQLMQAVLDWSDVTKPIILGVATYNERAKAFYRKWGFEEKPDSIELAYDKIPTVRMIRKGEKQ